ncbi:thioredoxin-related transmembrane protein 1-like [Convolutriloba macropyga]|uniref:thioredoxin-related transmembrane protein 1-like n=1 Tax=Convolutriloba macropyga TaxID=536237 RepID=UPI003F51CF2B
MERLHNVLYGNCLLIIALFTCTIYPNAAEMHILTDSNWTTVLKGDWFVEFYAPWCGACRSFEPIWQLFSEQSEDLNVNVGKVDITVESGLAARFLVSQLPTLYHISEDGTQFRKYNGKRRVDDLERFINDKEWMKIEPTVWYLKPNSIPMSIAGALAGVGEAMRVIVQMLTDTYGIPLWVIIVGMVIATIIVGVVLGLALVAIVGVIFPPKKVRAVPNVNSQEQEKTNDQQESADSKKDK